MGNIGSQSGNISPKNVLEEQWAHSFPRTQPRLQQHKVLPERDSRQKLRHTNNGEILQSGGTISGRPAFNRSLSMIDNRQEEANVRRQDEYSQPSRMYKSNQRDPLHKSGNRYTNLQNRQQTQNATQDKMKRFGSEPDLRYSTHVTPQGQDMQERSRAKKKYKAPAPPNPRKPDMEWEEHTRKQRLFKTQAETKILHSSPVNKQPREVIPTTEPKVELRSNRLSLPESKMPSTVEFQEELKEATKRLRYSRQEEVNTNKLKTLDPSIHDKEFRRKLREMQEENLTREEPSGKECSSEEKSPLPKVKEPTKTFYFGMDQPVNPLEYQNDIIDNFTSKLHANKKISTTSDSDLSSEPEMDDCQISKAGIDLQLRPMLPKKQLEIPRFSPAAAWKLLSTIDTSDPATSTIASDDCPVFIEDRIEKYSRPPPPTIQLGPRSSNDKSGDSGISGDAPGGFEDSQENLLNSRNNVDISWTPQQDLEDDSSIEEGVMNSLENTRDFQKKPHVFSLSLPRDNHLASYLVEKNTQNTTHLQKLKRSVSGVLNNLAQVKKPSSINQDQNDNWFLSKSAPNSLNNVPNTLETKATPKEDAPQSQSQTQSLGRVMYLPELDSNSERNRSRTKEDIRERSRSCERSRAAQQLSAFSKSCENISKETRPENLQDPPKQNECRSRKPKKFTFQSTVRQIERKRLADKLSREAERKESQRLRELEAMQKVEEEFQKKRAREKANIRQQLKMYSLDEPWTSLPPNIELKDEIPVRQEPDGAVSSAASSPPLVSKTPEYTKKKQKPKLRTSSESSEENKLKTPATQILSEFRQPQREYKEFRGSGRYLNELNDNSSRQATTIHPQVIYNMPKAKGQGGKKVSGTNYRKDFAHGVKSNTSIGSSNSDESMSRNTSSRLYHNKYAPITRF